MNRQEISSLSIAENHIPRDGNQYLLCERRGVHLLGTSVGAAAGGVVGGMAVGSVAGPIGAAAGIAAGAVAGAIGGGLAASAVAGRINAAAEHGFWRRHFAERRYVRARACYEEYAPAYQYGWESKIGHGDKSFEQAESTLRDDWYKIKGKCMLGWEDAREAVRDAWDRVSKALY